MPNSRSKIIMADDTTAASTTGNILETFFEVYPAPTADKFFEILENVVPDLILLDMELPDLDSDETVKRIKADKRFSDIPVILLAPQNNEKGELTGFELGAADCIAKPISGSSLLRHIVSRLLIVQQDRVTAVRGKAGAEIMEKINAMAYRNRQEGNIPGSRPRIILVDDNASNLAQGRNILKSTYEVYPAPSASKVFEILEKVIPDLILLDIEMPLMNGYETLKKLKEDNRFANIPVIFLTSLNDESSELEGFELGAVDYIAKPFSGPLLMRRIENQLLIVGQRKQLQRYTETLEARVIKKTTEVNHLQNAVIATVADLVEFRDKCTGGHIERTQLYMKALLGELIRRETYKKEISGWDINFFLPSVQLHDVGKIAISDLILNKPERLTPEEFEIMKTHVTVGVEAVQKIISNTEEHAFLRHSLSITGAHHEKWDGSGYPLGLKGYDIPLEGRLMAIADVYDALISDRPYKKAFTHQEASKIIVEGSGTHFDPLLVNIFRSVEDKFADIVQEVGGK